MSLFVAALFFALTPGVLVSLPAKGSKMAVAATHAVLFALVYHLTNKMVFNYLYGREGFAVRQAKGLKTAATVASTTGSVPA